MWLGSENAEIRGKSRKTACTGIKITATVEHFTYPVKTGISI